MKTIIATLALLSCSGLMRADDAVTIKGIAFIQTVEGDTKRMAAMKVYAVPIEAKAALDEPEDGSPQTVTLPKPLAVTVTDVDGKFTLTVDSDRQFFVYASGGYYTRFGHYIGLEWAIALEAIDDRSNLSLQNQNVRKPHRRVLIEGSQ